MDDNQRKVLELELELHKTEFSALRDEIMHSIDAERQALNLSLVAAGAGLSMVSFIDTQNVYFVILLFPFVFHVILWEMLGALKVQSRIASYFMKVLIPRVNQILKELGREQTDALVLGWEDYTANRSMKTSQLLLTSITPTRHWMPILAVGVLLGTYGVIANFNNHVPSSIELILVGVNLVLLVWAAVQNTITVRAYSQDAKSQADSEVAEG